MSALPDPPHADPPRAAFPLFRPTRGQHRATEDGHRLMWLAVAGAAVVVLVATLTLVLAGGGDGDGARPGAGYAVATESDPPVDPSVSEEPSPTPTASPSPSSAAPRPGADAAKLLAALKSRLDGLMQQGELRRKDGQNLQRRLRDAERALASGDVGRTRQKLREFTAALVELRSANRLSAAGYQALVAATTQLAEAL
ncbi:FIMAH domain-containing protein [Micromonospora sp. NPDC048930]|uniref:FIMAH domain-containing protein n=1 Tax=Micromonospora sp. NPDC048930 TaxID=3364261 RepID=UPI00371FD95F